MCLVRWIGFTQEGRGDHKSHVPPTLTIACVLLFALSGIANVLLLLFTRPQLLLSQGSATAEVIQDNTEADSIVGSTG
jgi:hypothetical protein